jgi:hypothetical protein
MFVATVRFFGPERGGRRSPPQSGYRPQLHLGAEYTSSAIESLDVNIVFELEREYRVKLRPLFPEHYASALSALDPGSLVSFYEGSRLIGDGTIIAKSEVEGFPR